MCGLRLTSALSSLFQGEIRLTGFNQEVDKFYSLIEVGKVRRSCKMMAMMMMMMIQPAWLSAKTGLRAACRRRIWLESLSAAAAASTLCVKTTESMNELSGWAGAAQ